MIIFYYYWMYSSLHSIYNNFYAWIRPPESSSCVVHLWHHLAQSEAVYLCESLTLNAPNSRDHISDHITPSLANTYVVRYDKLFIYYFRYFLTSFKSCLYCILYFMILKHVGLTLKVFCKLKVLLEFLNFSRLFFSSVQVGSTWSCAWNFRFISFSFCAIL